MFQLYGFQLLALLIRQLQVLKHNLNQFIQGDLGLVVVGAGRVTCLLRTRVGIRVAADHLSRLGLTFSLAYLGMICPEAEAVLFDPPYRYLDDPIATLADNRLLGDDVGDVLADRLANLETVTGAVSGAAIAALSV